MMAVEPDEMTDRTTVAIEDGVKIIREFRDHAPEFDELFLRACETVSVEVKFPTVTGSLPLGWKPVDHARQRTARCVQQPEEKEQTMIAGNNS